MKPWFFSLLILIAAPAMAASIGASETAIGRGKTSHGDSYALLGVNVRGKVLGYAFGHSRDRAQIHVLLDPGNGQAPEEAWVHYRPDLSDRRQTLTLFDQDGRSTLDVTQAKSLVTIRPGVTAWPSMEHVTYEITAEFRKLSVAPKVAAKAAGKQSRSVASNAVLTSSQPLLPGNVWSANCEDFIDADGNFGSIGESLENQLDANTTPQLFSTTSGDIATICPNYAAFDDNQKKNFWVWFAAAVSMEESSCDPDRSARGTNATAAGLWQLDARGTSSYCGGVCGSIDVYDGSQNAACGLKMLDWYTGADPRNTKKLIYWEGNYWETLHPFRRHDQKVNRLVQAYSACH